MSDWDMVFADDERESNPTTFMFLQAAHAWKKSGASNPAAILGTLPGKSSTSTAAKEDDTPQETTTPSDDAPGSDVASSHGDE